MKAIGPPARPDGIETCPHVLPKVQSHGQGALLWFVRHAEVAERWHETAYGNMNVELSEHGVQQTEDMAQAFDNVAVDRVISSDLDRARAMGAGIAAASGASLETTLSLREMDRGDWQGLDKSDFIERWKKDAHNYWSDPFHWHVPGGEGDAMLFERAYPVLASALQALPTGTLVITAHGQLIRVLLSRFLRVDVPGSYELYPDPAHGTCLRDGPSGWELVRRNVGAQAIAP